MKRFLFFCVFAISAVSCIREGAILCKMKDVESYVHEAPDSALVVLASLDTTGISMAIVDARYTLLNSIARYRLYLDESNDAALMRAADYFRLHHDDDRLMKALFLAGYIQYKQADYRKAILTLTEAEGISDELENHFYGGLICRQMAFVFEMTFNTVGRLESAKKACELFQKGGYETHERYSRLQLGQAYLANEMFDDGDGVLFDVIQSGQESKDTVLLASALLSYAEGMILRPDKQPEIVLDETRIVCDSLHYQLPLFAWINAAYSAALLGDKDYSNDLFVVARSYAVSDHDNYLTDYREYESAIALNEPERALQASQRFLGYLQAKQIDIERESLVIPQRDYYQKEKQIEQLNHSITRHKLIIAVFLLGLLAISSVWGIKALMRRKRLLRWENALLSNKIQDMESAHSHALKVSFESGMKLLNTLAEFKWVNQPYKILPYVESILSDLASDERTIKEMMTTLNETRGNLMVRLEEQVPSLKKDDLMVYCYLALQLDHMTLCTILNKTPGALNAKVYRLREKIEKSLAPDKTEFLSVIKG